MQTYQQHMTEFGVKFICKTKVIRSMNSNLVEIIELFLHKKRQTVVQNGQIQLEICKGSLLRPLT